LAVAALILVGSFITCGSATPPASIPAPVSGLIFVSTPDDDGDVTVVGAAGAVDNDATVTVTNGTTGVSVLTTDIDNYNGEYGSYYLIAGADGSFSGQIPGSVGDVMSITQTSGGQTSSVTTYSGNSQPRIFFGEFNYDKLI